jgi:hypothetical protein
VGATVHEPVRPELAVLVAVDPRSRSTDRAGAEERLEAQHRTRRILDQVHVGAREFLQRQPVTAAVMDRPEIAGQEPVRELVGVDLVGLVAAMFATPIADDHAIHDRREQVVQPLRLRAFLEGDVDRATHRTEELDQRGMPGGQDAARSRPRAARGPLPWSLPGARRGPHISSAS